MTEKSYGASYQWPNWLTFILGVWLFVSPWVLPAAAAGAWAWNAWVVGVLLAVVSIAALAQLAEWEEWINLVLGAWLFFSPWIFSYVAMTSASWNAYIVGIATVLIAAWGIVAARQAMGGLTAHSH